jgi:glycosyltransferase involved in cell wall biosynthesis
MKLNEVMTSQHGTINVVRYCYAPIRGMETLTYPGATASRIKEKPLRILLVPLLLFGMYRAIKKQLKVGNYDCVNAHWFIPQGAIQLLFKGEKYPPFVVTGHGGDVWSLNNSICEYLKRKQLHAASKITVVSEALRDKLYTFLKPQEAIDKDKIEVIPMGCDVEKFSPDNRKDGFFNDTLGIDGTIILYVGRLAEVKGITYLIDAFAYDSIMNTDAKLVIVGDGSLRHTLEVKVNNMGLQERIVFFGHASHEQLKEMYASCDIFCSPSIVAKDGNREGFLVTNVEASASGAAVVTTKNTMSYIQNGTAYAVDDKDSDQLANALHKLIVDENERERLSKNGVEWAKQLAWGKIALRFSTVIYSTLRQGD